MPHMQTQMHPEPIESPIPVPVHTGLPQVLNTRDDPSPDPGTVNKATGGVRKDEVARGKTSPQAPTKGHRVPIPSDRPVPSPTYVLDVLTPLQSTLASHGLISVTPIALLKLDPLYLPGTTIGVSSFIAYAMTKGRVRLIARSNGARALLKLPPTFPLSTSVQGIASRSGVPGLRGRGGSGDRARLCPQGCEWGLFGGEGEGEVTRYGPLLNTRVRKIPSGGGVSGPSTLH